MKKFLGLCLLIILVAGQTISFAIADTTTSSTVSLTVPAHPSDFSTTTTTLATGTMHQDDTRVYSVTYHSYLSSIVPITVKATWTDGAYSGGTVPVVSYVLNSATNAYNNTAPVVDTENKTITWSIPTFPGNSEGTVEFSLKATSTYGHTDPLTFSVSSSIDAVTISTSESTITTTYQYTPPPAATPTPTPTPSSTTTSQPTPTPTPTPQKTPTFQTITVTGLSTASAQFRIVVSPETALTLYSGISSTNLVKQVTSPINTTHLITLTNLKPLTTYFAKFVTSTSPVITSDIISFTTPADTTTPLFTPGSLIITSDKNIISAPDSVSPLTQDKTPLNSPTQTAILPQNTVYEIRFRLSLPESVKHIQVILRKQGGISETSHIFASTSQLISPILGASTGPQSTEQDQKVELTEIEPGIYVAKVITKPLSGTYDVYIHISTTSGGVTEQKIGTLIVVSPLTILDSKTKKPIEGAKVTLATYNPKTKTYVPVAPDMLQIKSPAFSDENGIVQLSLPKGKYQVHVTSLNYDDKTVEFAIGTGASNYPTIALTPQKTTLFKAISFYAANTIEMTANTFRMYLASLKLSPKSFQTRAVFSLVLLVIICLLAFYTRTHLTPWHIPSFIYERIHQHFHKETHTAYQGRVYHHSIPLSGVHITITHPTTHQVIKQLTTDNKGIFVASLPTNTIYTITFSKEGYELQSKRTSEDLSHIVLLSTNTFHTLAQESLRLIIHWLSFMFEVILITSLIVEMLFMTRFGIVTTLPFFLLSGINTLAWILYIQEK